MKRLGIFLAITAFLSVTTCNTRDYYTSVINDYYQGPQIIIRSPSAHSSQYIYLDLITFVTDSGGVQSVDINTSDATTNSFHYGFPDMPTSVTLTNRFYYCSQGNKNIHINAKDNLGIDSEGGVEYDLYTAYNELDIDQSYSTTFYTNAYMLYFSGRAFVTNNYYPYNSQTVVDFDRVEILRNGIVCGNATINSVAGGTNYWSCTVTLLTNQSNNISLRSMSDVGSYSLRDYYITMDRIPPVVSILSPTNNGTYTYKFDAHVHASDNSGEIRSMFCYMDVMGSTNVYDTTDYWVGANIDSEGQHTTFAYAYDRAGNRSVNVTNKFYVNTGIPLISFDKPEVYTNVVRMTVSGTASVGTGHTVASVSIKLNNGSYSPISISAGQTVTFSSDISNMANNSTNKVYIMAKGDTGYSNVVFCTVYIDRTPPTFVSLSPATGAVVNSIYPYYSATLSDNLSGLDKLYGEVKCSGGGATVNYTHYIGYATTFSITETNTSSSFYAGAAVTNWIRISDRAGNTAVKTNIFNLLPAVVVATNGNDNNVGNYYSPLLTLAKAVSTAQANKLQNIYVMSGTYTPGSGLATGGYGVTLSGISDLNIRGSYYMYGYQDLDNQPTIFDMQGTTGSAVYAVNCANLNLSGLKIVNAITTGNGAAIYFNNVNYSSIYYSTVSNNTASLNGGGIYIKGNTNSVYDVMILSNEALLYGGGIYVQGTENYFSSLTLHYNRCGVASLGGGIYSTSYLNSLSLGTSVYSPNYRGTGSMIEDNYDGISIN